MRTLFQDIRFGIRMLRRNPGFTLTVVLCLGLGIGANTAIFTVVDRVMLDPIPARDAHRLVEIREVNPALNRVQRVSAPLFLELWEEKDVFEDLVAFNYESVPFFSGEFPERLDGFEVTPNFFNYLGVQPILGRTFLPDEGRPGNNRVVVISHGFWQRRFGCDPNLVGKTLIFGSANLLKSEVRRPYMVIGIMPPNFQFPRKDFVFCIPRAFTQQYADRYPARWMRNWSTVARLKPNVSLQQARVVLDTMAQRLAGDYPKTNKDWHIDIRPLQNMFTSKNTQQTLFGLMGAIVFVQLIACANVANLLLARSQKRQKEIAIRMALGAGRSHLVRLLLTEAILLALLAGGLGLLLTYWGIDLLTGLVSARIPRLQQVGVDIGVLAATVFISVLTGVVFGLGPAWQSFNPQFSEALKESQRTVNFGFGRLHVRNLLVGSEIALALVLLIGSGLLIQSVVRLLRVDTGFDPHNLVGFQVEAPQTGYEEFGQRQAFYRQLSERFRALPGVRSVGVCRPQGNSDYEVEGQTTPIQIARTYCGVGDIDYFRAMRIPLLKGRLLTEADADASPANIVVNETMARQLWPGEDPLGKRFGRTEDIEGYVVVGVVANVKDYRLDQEPYARYYLPFEGLLRSSMPFGHFMLRTYGDPLTLTKAIRSIIRELIPNSPAPYIWSVEENLLHSTKTHRTYMLYISCFATVGLILAVVGIYGVMSYAVARRTKEIGIRMALGAQRGDVLKLMLKKGLALIVVGLVIGAGGALAVTHVLRSLLFGVTPTDPMTFVAVSLLLMVVGLVACYIPARRATKIDPMSALRYE